MPGIPHGYPFLFVDRIEGDRAILGVSAGSRAAQGFDPPTLPASLLLESMAQATLALMIAEATSAATAPERDTAKPTGGLLAGVDEAQFDESLLQAPPRPGDRFVAGCEVLGRFGRLSKVAAWMERDGVRVATATMLLASG